MSPDFHMKPVLLLFQMNSEIHKMLGLKPGSKLSRSVLTSMTVGQLEFILNYLLSQIEILNEDLVQFLIARDELAIEQVKYVMHLS